MRGCCRLSLCYRYICRVIQRTGECWEGQHHQATMSPKPFFHHLQKSPYVMLAYSSKGNHNVNFANQHCYYEVKMQSQNKEQMNHCALVALLILNVPGFCDLVRGGICVLWQRFC